MNAKYKAQVELLLDILPYVSKEKCFALKGGTAINMFVWDMYRLSVDIDLTYLPIDPRQSALKNISTALNDIRNSILKSIPIIKIKASGAEAGVDDKLMCALGNTKVKIEVNTTMRGSIYPAQTMQLSQSVQNEFRKFSAIQVMSHGELFGGKICAALDRQHPRDLFDVHYLLEAEGFTEEVKNGFIAALLSHNHPIHEMLSPNFKDQRQAFNAQFDGMALRPFSYEVFESERERLVQLVRTSLTQKDKQFLLSFKAGDPDWDLNKIEKLQLLPAIGWKLLNIRKFAKADPKRHADALRKLEKVLMS